MSATYNHGTNSLQCKIHSLSHLLGILRWKAQSCWLDVTSLVLKCIQHSAPKRMNVATGSEDMEVSLYGLWEAERPDSSFICKDKSFWLSTCMSYRTKIALLAWLSLPLPFFSYSLRGFLFLKLLYDAILSPFKTKQNKIKTAHFEGFHRQFSNLQSTTLKFKPFRRFQVAVQILYARR